MKILFIVGLLCLSVLGYSQSNYPMPQTQAERETIKKNNVKSCSVTYFEVDNKKKTKTSDFENTEFDEEGYLTKEVWGWKEPKDISTETTRFIYNDKKQLQAEIVHDFDYDGKEKEEYEDRTVYTYNEEGKLIKDCWFTKDPGQKNFSQHSCTTYEYVNGKLNGENNGWNEMEYAYEYKGDTVIKRVKGNTEIIGKHVGEKTIYSKWEKTEYYYFYNTNGLLERTEVYKEGVLDHFVEMIYKNGLLHEVITKTKDSVITETEVYKYEFYK